MKIFIIWILLSIPNFLEAQHKVTFSAIMIDSTASGDDKAIADIDNDGIKDLILGGHHFSWYRNQNKKYEKYTIAEPEVEFSTDMAVADFDNDGDIDLLVADGKIENNVMWYENPLPALSPTKSNNWKKHSIGSHGEWMHNTAIGDVNGDHRIDVVSSGHGFTRLWMNKGNDEWKQINLSPYGGGAVDLYDIDGDGDLDLVTTKGWVECPADPFTGEWMFHPIHDMNSETVKAGDIDNDGIPEIISADSSHVNGPLYMYKAGASLRDSVWNKIEIDANCGTHKLQIADVNHDGYPDIIFGLELKDLGILYQRPSNPGTFVKQIISPNGGHNAIADDVDNDGDLDILSCDYLNHPPLRLFINNYTVRTHKNKNKNKNKKKKH